VEIPGFLVAVIRGARGDLCCTNKNRILSLRHDQSPIALFRSETSLDDFRVLDED
jgi:hypothetical protein